MANTKISALTSASPLGGTEEFPVALSAANYKVTAAQIKTFCSTAPALTGAVSIDSDVILVREAANTLAQRNGANAQVFRLYNTYTDGSNYERGAVVWNSNVLEIGTEKLGTGATRALSFKVGGTVVWTFDTTGHLVPSSSGTYEIGTSTVMVNTVYTSVVSGGSASLSISPNNSASVLNFNTSGLRAGASHRLGWSSASSGGGGTWDTWLDRAAAGRVKVNAASSLGQLQVGGLSVGYNAKTANFTTSVLEHTYRVDTTSGNVTATLITAVGNEGVQFTFRKLVAANSLIIDGDSTETINGATTITLTNIYDSVTIESDGANWMIVARGGRKTVIPVVSSNTSITSPLAWNSDDNDMVAITAQAGNLTINADSGTPVNGQKMLFRIKDDGTPRTLTWTTGSSKAFKANGKTPPATTTAGKTTYVLCIYNSSADRWDVVAVETEA